MAYVTVGDAAASTDASLLMRNAGLRLPKSTTLQRLPDGSTQVKASSLPIVPIVGGLAVAGVLVLLLFRKKG